MNMAAHQAAAAAARRRREEEEDLTPYDASDLMDDQFEFKIVRSAVDYFNKPEKLKAVLEEESRAGWSLIEKFDNQRIRLKRPVSARKNDASLTLDPYRANVGISEGAMVGLILLGIFLLIGILVALMYGGSLVSQYTAARSLHR